MNKIWKNKKQKNREFFLPAPFPRNRKGWLRIVEAFTTVLLVSIVLLLILNRSSFTEAEKTEQILDREYAILREIQLNNTLRDFMFDVELESEVFDAPEEILWADFAIDEGLNKVRLKIEQRTPAQLNCSAKLCTIDSTCSFEFEEDFEKSIYSRSSLISANITEYKPRVLKLFCWEF